MRETEYKEIDGIKYLCKMMPGDVAIELEAEMVQRIGRPAAAMMSRAFMSNPEASGVADLGASVEGLVAGGLQVFLHELSPQEVREYMQKALNGVEAEGVGPIHTDEVFASHFRGSTAHMRRVFLWSMEVNFRDFFSDALSHPLIAGLVRGISGALSARTPAQSSSDSSSRQTVSMTKPPTEEPKPG